MRHCEGKLSGRKSEGNRWRGPRVASLSAGKQVTDEGKPSAISEGSKGQEDKKCDQGSAIFHHCGME